MRFDFEFEKSILVSHKEMTCCQIHFIIEHRNSVGLNEKLSYSSHWDTFEANNLDITPTTWNRIIAARKFTFVNWKKFTRKRTWFEIYYKLKLFIK